MESFERYSKDIVTGQREILCPLDRADFRGLCEIVSGRNVVNVEEVV